TVIHVVAAEGATAILANAAAALHVVAVLVAVAPVAAEVTLFSVPAFAELPFLAPAALATESSGEDEDERRNDSASEPTEHQIPCGSISAARAATGAREQKRKA